MTGMRFVDEGMSRQREIFGSWIAGVFGAFLRESSALGTDTISMP